MAGAAPWRLYSSETEPTHIAHPGGDETCCGDPLEMYRPQGRVTDPSAFHAHDQFCADCLYDVLGTQAGAYLERRAESDE